MITQTSRTLHSTGRRFAASLPSRPAGMLSASLRVLAITLVVAAFTPLFGHTAGAAGGGDKLIIRALDCEAAPLGTAWDQLNCRSFPDLSFEILTAEEALGTVTDSDGATMWSGNTTYLSVAEDVPAGYRVEVYCSLNETLALDQLNWIADLVDFGDGSTVASLDRGRAHTVVCAFYNIKLGSPGAAVEFDDGVLANGIIAQEDAAIAGFDRGALANAVEAPTASSVSIDVHSCPDDFAGTGFYQHLSACTSERGLYGVPLKLTDGNGVVSYLYSQPDGTGGAAPMEWANVAAGPVTIAEVYSDRPRESIVFCSLRTSGNQPGELDGTEIPVVNGAISGNLEPGDELICDWHRFPGGVVGEPADEQPAGENGEIELTKRICPMPLTDSGMLTGHPENDLDAYLAVCESYQDGVTFTLTDEYGDTSQDTFDGQVSWYDLAAGDYTIAETIPAGYGNPVVFCEGNVPGRQYLRRNLVQHDASGGYIVLPLEQGEVVTCDWFNIFAGDPDPHADDDDMPSSTDSSNGDGGAVDSDGDGITDEDEYDAFGTDPYLTDSDDDGLNDDEEIFYYGTDPLSDDTDGDLLVDGDEINLAWTDPASFDTDGDGADDGTEVYDYGTDPLDPTSV